MSERKAVSTVAEHPGSARSWRRSIAIAAGSLYGPQLLPLALTDILDHGHCLEIYAWHFPILSGFAMGIRARIESGLGEPQQEFVLYGVASFIAIGFFAATTLSLRRWRRGGRVAAVVTALFSALFSLAAVAIIRS